MPDPIAAQRQQLIKVIGVEGTFATKTGGATTAETNRYYDGGQKDPEVMASPAQTENIVVSRGFRPVRDRAIVKRLRPLVGTWRTEVSAQDLTQNLVVIPGTLTSYTNALLVRVTEPDHDANSGDPETLELEFAVESVV